MCHFIIIRQDSLLVMVFLRVKTLPITQQELDSKKHDNRAKKKAIKHDGGTEKYE